MPFPARFERRWLSGALGCLWASPTMAVVRPIASESDRETGHGAPGATKAVSGGGGSSDPDQPGAGGGAFVRSLWRLIGSLLLLGLVAMPLDLPVARAVRAGALPGEVNRLLGISEAFAHGWGVAAILLAAFALDAGLWRRATTSRRERWTPSAAGFRLVAMAVVGSLFVDVIKLGARRVRPRAANLEVATDALATFDPALVSVPDPGSADLLSFPSGHAAAAAGLAAALAYRYPRGARLFFLFAVLAALQRVSSAAHYPSDICCGAAVGCLGALLALRLADRPGRHAGSSAATEPGRPDLAG